MSKPQAKSAELANSSEEQSSTDVLVSIWLFFHKLLRFIPSSRDPPSLKVCPCLTLFQCNFLKKTPSQIYKHHDTIAEDVPISSKAVRILH